MNEIFESPRKEVRDEIGIRLEDQEDSKLLVTHTKHTNFFGVRCKFGSSYRVGSLTFVTEVELDWTLLLK